MGCRSSALDRTGQRDQREASHYHYWLSNERIGTDRCSVVAQVAALLATSDEALATEVLASAERAWQIIDISTLQLVYTFAQSAPHAKCITAHFMGASAS